MLKRLLNGGEETNSIVFCPETNLSETQLANEFLATQSDISVISTDPLDGIKHDKVFNIYQFLKFDDTRSLQELTSDLKLDKKGCVLVKSVSGLLFNFTPTQVARFIKYLQGVCKKVYCVIHSDCVEQDVYQSIIKLFSTQIIIEPHPQLKTKKICSIIHRKPSGKIVRSKEVFSILSGKLEVETFVAKVKEDVESDEDITSSLTTFNLGTKKSEEEVKNNLVLPFYTQQQKSNFQGEVKVHEESNKIYYEPDSGDDWDDEDPDDDLDI